MPQTTRQQELESQGWRRMTTTDEPRLSELAEEYGLLGFEVHLEPIHIDEEAVCTECIAQAPDRFRTIYVRRGDPG